MARRRSADEIQQVVEQFRASGLSQGEYCRQTGMVLSTLGRYVRRIKSPGQRLVRVNVEAAAEAGTIFCADARQRSANRHWVRIRGRRIGPPDPGRGKRVMFGLGPATKIYIAVEGVDLRKGFDGLFGLVRDRLGEDPLSGHLFLFANRDRSRLKILVWDGSGLWVCAKRLERGRFRWPTSQDQQCVVMRPEELAMLLSGLDVGEARARKNWLRRAPAA